jgi:hypothetical protein
VVNLQLEVLSLYADWIRFSPVERVRENESLIRPIVPSYRRWNAPDIALQRCIGRRVVSSTLCIAVRSNVTDEWGRTPLMDAAHLRLLASFSGVQIDRHSFARKLCHRSLQAQMHLMSLSASTRAGVRDFRGSFVAAVDAAGRTSSAFSSERLGARSVSRSNAQQRERFTGQQTECITTSSGTGASRAAVPPDVRERVRADEAKRNRAEAVWPQHQARLKNGEGRQRRSRRRERGSDRGRLERSEVDAREKEDPELNRAPHRLGENPKHREEGIRVPEK